MQLCYPNRFHWSVYRTAPPTAGGMHLHGSIRGCWCQLDAWMATVDRHRHGNVAPPSLAVSSVDTGPFLSMVYCFRVRCSGARLHRMNVVLQWSARALIKPARACSAQLRSVIASLRPSVTSNTCARTVTGEDMTDDRVVGSRRRASYLQHVLWWAGKPGLICFVNPINLPQMSQQNTTEGRCCAACRVSA